MHEMSLARNLLKTIEVNLGHDRVRVSRIDVAIGCATGVVAESLQLAFSLVATGTRAEGAKLAIVSVPARSLCAGCGILFEFDSLIGTCPACGRMGGDLRSGSEMTLRSIEVLDV
ncbi:MAG: hydrogenase maturation nickel metallochaperone HypA [Deltaproteobacteria bacterium]|nr:hydrogenase maturation nickel metallochaperone HypA [Deltaproteobacteria bacterium]